MTTKYVERPSGRVDAAVIAEAARAAGRRVGVDVLDVCVKDVIVPAEIRTAAMQLVTAKARGAAQLEEARAETAALRALANAGKLLDAHPALAQLRLVQAAPYGSRVVLAVGRADVDAERESDYTSGSGAAAVGGSGINLVSYTHGNDAAHQRGADRSVAQAGRRRRAVDAGRRAVGH